MNESAYTRWVCKCLEAAGARVTAIVGGPRQPAGLPDRHVAHRDLPGGVWVEFKKNDQKLKTIQRLTIQEWVARGTSAMVMRFHERDDRMHIEYPPEWERLVCLGSDCHPMPLSSLRQLKPRVVGSIVLGWLAVERSRRT